MALYIQLSTQNVLAKYLSISSITGGNSVNTQQLVSTVASLGTTGSPSLPPFISTQALFASSVTTSSLTTTSLATSSLITSSMTANSVTSGVLSTLVLYASSIVGVTTGGGGIATIPDILSTSAILTSSLRVSTLVGNTLSAQQLFVSSIQANTIVSSNLFVSSGVVSSFSTNNINFASGFGYLTMPDIYPNTVYTSTVTSSNLLVGYNSVISPIQFFGFGTYSNTVISELSTGGTTQELLFFRGSNASDRIRMQTTGSVVFEPGVSARIWPTAPSNVTPAMIINTSSNVGIQTATPATTLDVAGTGRFQIVSTLALTLSSINGTVYTTGSGGVTTIPQNLSTFAILTSSLRASTIISRLITTESTITSTIISRLNTSESTLTSSFNLTGPGIVKFNGTNSASLYGYGVDSLSLQTTCNSYVGGIASLAFATASSAYPLGRIYALDSAISGSPVSQLVFQNVPVSATSFNSNFSYTGANQTFTVPTGVTSVQATIWGAGGAGGYNGGGGGAGAFVQGVLTVIPGQTYTIVVGQGGVMNSGSSTYGGGGGSGGGNPGGSSGGGRSAIMLNVTVTITAASGSGSAITYTTSGTHGLAIGQPVLISGLSPSGFNGSFAIATLPGTNQFTVVSTQSGSSTGTGAILAEVVNAGGGGSGGYNGGLGGAAQFSGTALNAPDSGSFRGGKGGTQTAGGAGGAGSTWNGAVLQGGLGLSLAGGGGGGFYGGGGGEWAPGGAAGGGGGSTYTANSAFSLSLGLNSPNSGTQAPGTAITGYVAGTAVGGTSFQTTSTGNGGNGLVILNSIGGSITEAMRIGSNGYLGVATPTPLYQLDVAGTGRLSNLYLGTNSTIVSQQFFGLFGNYNNTVLAEISSGVGAQELLMFKGSSSSDRVRVQTTGNFVVETGVSSRLWASNGLNTLSNVTPAFIINTSSNVGIQTATPGATLDVVGTGRFQTLSSLALNVSSINGATPGAGSGGVNQIVAGSNVTISPVNGLGIVTINASGGGGGITSLPQNISSVSLSTVSLFTNNSYLGVANDATEIQFYGTSGNYNNSIIAEISTGSGTQEMLFFKGSTITDRFRFQTTGNFVVETGVSSRLFASTTVNTLSNPTPAMIIDTNSNMGIQTATPGATLDVAGSGRFITTSSVSVFTGAFYTGVFFV